MFIQKMHYSLTSCQLYFLVPLSSFLAHLLALSHMCMHPCVPEHACVMCVCVCVGGGGDVSNGSIHVCICAHEHVCVACLYVCVYTYLGVGGYMCVRPCVNVCT